MERTIKGAVQIPAIGDKGRKRKKKRKKRKKKNLKQPRNAQEHLLVSRCVEQQTL